MHNYRRNAHLGYGGWRLPNGIYIHHFLPFHRFENQRERLNGKLFSILFLISSGVLFVFFDLLVMPNT
jgi:hypothetical protein